MARFLLDTNIISYASSGRSSRALERIMAHPPEKILVSAISCGELWYGLRRRAVGERLRTATTALLAEATLVPWTPKTAEVYADLRFAMESTGISLQPLDLLIAAHALEADATLVTNDAAFRHVPGLTGEDWTAP